MFYPRFNPYRAMRGGLLAGSPTNLGTLSVFNDSTGADLIAIWGVLSTEAITLQQAFGATQGALGAATGTMQSYITGEPRKAGQLNYLDTTTVLAPSLVLNGVYSQSVTILPPVPLAILQPGWSCYVQNQNAARVLSVSFLWQAVHIEDLRGIYCPICDFAITPTS